MNNYTYIEFESEDITEIVGIVIEGNLYLPVDHSKEADIKINFDKDGVIQIKEIE